MMTIPRDRFLSFSFESVAIPQEHLITAFNLPATAVEALISALTTWPNSWHPQALPLPAWRVLFFPFASIPFWAFAGMGVEAVLKIGRLPPRSVLILGTALCAVALFLLFGLYFGLSAQDLAEGHWILLGFSLWALLFGTFPAAWISRRRASTLRPE